MAERVCGLRGLQFGDMITGIRFNEGKASSSMQLWLYSTMVSKSVVEYSAMSKLGVSFAFSLLTPWLFFHYFYHSSVVVSDSGATHDSTSVMLDNLTVGLQRSQGHGVANDFEGFRWSPFVNPVAALNIPPMSLMFHGFYIW